MARVGSRSEESEIAARPPSKAWDDFYLQEGYELEEFREGSLPRLRRVRNQVLQAAQVRKADRILDFEANNNGLLGFGCFDYLGSTGHVTFCDAEELSMDRCLEFASELGISAQCTFLEDVDHVQTFTRLAALPDASLDLVVDYMGVGAAADGPRLMREFYRLLALGGRISIAEPVPRFAPLQSENMLWGVDVTPFQDEAKDVKAFEYDFLQTSERPAPVETPERDLVLWGWQAGFRGFSLRLDAEYNPRPMKWKTFINWVDNLKMVPRYEVLELAVAGRETDLMNHMRPLVESGQVESQSADVYLLAAKP